MNQDSGTDRTKLVTTTDGIQKKACCTSAGVSKTAIKPAPKTTAFTIKKINAETRSLALVSLLMFASCLADLALDGRWLAGWPLRRKQLKTV
jgi:hypothetical protein